QVGWIFFAFGLGSMLGSWLGGILTDRWGFHPVMFWSLALSGCLFIALQWVHTFEGLCVGVFILLSVADTFRPAAYTAVNTYSKPENRTRSMTLIRLAVNLGTSAGPAAGGLLIVTIGYAGLFWCDGLTCVAAAFLFIGLLSRKQASKDADAVTVTAPLSPQQDTPFLVFLVIAFFTGFAFMQFIAVMPVYYREVYLLQEDQIGLLITLNGVLICLLEMQLIRFVENAGYSIFRILFGSVLLMAASFVVLNLGYWGGWMVISMVLLTFGEMLNFPFMNRFAMDRASRGKTGAFMGMFTLAFSLAHIFGMFGGMRLVEFLGYDTTWYIMAGVLLFTGTLTIVLRKMVHKEKPVETPPLEEAA
ncbi:MAG: MFS transporter, partial [Bacteroidota bacterium]